MIYGRMFALATLGLLSDLVARGRNYVLLAFFAILACIIHLVQIVFLITKFAFPYVDVF